MLYSKFIQKRYWVTHIFANAFCYKNAIKCFYPQKFSRFTPAKPFITYHAFSIECTRWCLRVLVRFGSKQIGSDAVFAATFSVIQQSELFILEIEKHFASITRICRVICNTVTHHKSAMAFKFWLWIELHDNRFWPLIKQYPNENCLCWVISIAKYTKGDPNIHTYIHVYIWMVE